MHTTLVAPPVTSPEQHGDRVAHRINAHDPRELLTWYERAGFLYPEKRQRLEPVLGRALRAWNRSLSLGETLRRTSTYEKDGRWAAMDQWLSCSGTWTVQHLVSNGGGVGTRATTIGGLDHSLADPAARAWDCWFRMNNPMPRRVLATSVASVGPDYSSLAEHELIAVPRRSMRIDPPSGSVWVEPVAQEDLDASGVLSLVRRERGEVFVQAQDLASGDPLLRSLDATYRQVNLRRYRDIVAAYLPHRVGPAGVALSHRGPIATNFSFLENRCDLVLASDLDPDQRREVVLALSAGAAYSYKHNDPPPFIPFVTDAEAAETLLAHGGQRIQRYAHVTWLREGMGTLRDHLEACFRVLAARESR